MYKKGRLDNANLCRNLIDPYEKENKTSFFAGFSAVGQSQWKQIGDGKNDEVFGEENWFEGIDEDEGACGVNVVNKGTAGMKKIKGCGGMKVNATHVKKSISDM